MITIYDKSGNISNQYEDWKLPSAQMMVDQHNETHDEKQYIETRDLDTLVFEAGTFREKTDAEKVADGSMTATEKYEKELAECHAKRRAAYISESDCLKIEAEYDALASGATPDFTAWSNKVAEIKSRYPKPVKPK